MLTQKAAIFNFFLPMLALFSSCSSGTRPANANPDRKIKFSGYSWTVRNTPNKQGPGPNYFSDTDVSVDKNGYLHLFIKRDAASGEWSSAEVTADNLSGFGTYQFVVEGPLDRLDKNVVLGLFNYSGNDGLDEMDIEFARWGNDSYPNLNYT
ncbi:MAG TPA: hypothetical protein VK588_00995, partial [Chitinophagaceae bacterium]|nr:hypothetical protein [Chitinophagaceae bacterium]